jgi:hypothetical protein
MKNYQMYYSNNFQCYEKLKYLEEENTTLNNKLLKKETALSQELTDKEVMFIRLQNLEKENDKLNEQVRMR